MGHVRSLTDVALLIAIKESTFKGGLNRLRVYMSLSTNEKH